MPRRLIQFIFILIALLFATSVKAGTIIRPVHNFGLVGYWDFQEGAGTIANDKSGHSNHFILHGNPAWVDGKIGKALYFDNSNTQYGIIADTDQNGLEFNGGNYTVNFWVKFETVGTNQGIFAKYNSGADGYYIGWFWPVDSYHLYANHWENSSNNGEESSFGTSDVEVGPWYMMSVIFNDTTNEIVFCLNAVCDAPDTMEYTSLGNAADVELARVDASDYFNGTLDEFRVYNRALSESEIQRIYKLSQPKILAKTRTGLVGYWSFDEGTGTKVGDMSNSGNHGTWYGSGSHWTTGKFGNGGSFNGSDDYVSIPYTSSLQLTHPAAVSFWANFSSTGSSGEGGIVNSGTGGPVGNFAIAASSAGRLSIWDTSKHYFSPDYSLPKNQWVHIVVNYLSSSKTDLYVNGAYYGTTAGGLGATNMTEACIGTNCYFSGTENFGGKIDEVRIYNRDLNPNEITALYNSGLAKVSNSQNNQLTNGLVGLWSFNGSDIDGNEAIDRSGNGNTGTIIGATPTIGKVGQALSFDGSSDYVDTNAEMGIDGMTELSVCAWIYWAPSSVDKDATVVSKWDDSDTGMLMWVDDTGAISGRTNTITWTIKTDGSWEGRVEGSTGLVTPQTWNYFCGTFKGGSFVRLYKNGILDQEVTSGIEASVEASTANVRIGRSSNTGSPRYFDGKIDEVRIYNRVLSAQEIQRLYNLGR